MLSKNLASVLRTTNRHLAKLEDLGIKTVKDFLLYFPRTYNNTTQFKKISEILLDEVNTIKGQLTNLFNIRTKYGKKIQKAILSDHTGETEIVWYNQPYLVNVIKVGVTVSISGSVKKFGSKFVIVSPDYEIIRPTTNHQRPIANLVHTGNWFSYHPTMKLLSRQLILYIQEDLLRSTLKLKA